MQLRWPIAAWLSFLICLGLASCPSTGNSDGVDWGIVSRELTLTAVDARDAVDAFEDAELKETLTQIAVILEQAAAILTDEDGEPADALEIMDRALVLGETLIEQLPEDSRPQARVALLLTRAIVRRVEAYRGTDEGEP